MKRFFTRPSTLLQDDRASTSTLFPSIPYAITTEVRRPPTKAPNTPRTIPMEVLKGIEVMVEAPEHLVLDQTQVPFIVRLRPSKEFPQDTLLKTRIVGFNMDVRQQESYRSLPRPAYMRRFPIPLKSQQPPKVPLLFPHPLRDLYELGIAAAPNSGDGPGVQYDVDFSLLPSHSAQSSFRVANGGLHLEQGAAVSFDISLNLRGDFNREGHHAKTASSSKAEEWKCIRTTDESPFLTVRHQLLVELICQYQHDAAEDDDAATPSIAQELLRFSIPLHFVVPAASFINSFSGSFSSISLNAPSQQTSIDTHQNPYGKHASMKIPAYSQLFYSNGDPRFNDWDLHGESLPAYRKDEENAKDNEIPAGASSTP